MAELAFERLLVGIETARGTANTAPTRYLNMAGTITPRKDRYRPDESRGTLSEYYRSTDVRKWSEIEADNGLDVYTLPTLLNALLVGGVTTPTTPATATLSRLWTFEPDQTADSLKTLTLFWGDPAVQEFMATYGILDELKIAADASSTDGATMSISGHARFPSKAAPASVPTMLSAPLLMPTAMQLWIDTATIATTAITARVISAETTFTSGVSYKWLAAGPTATLDYQAIGRGKRHAEMKLVFEVPDMVQYDLWAAATTLKTRLRINGPLIEAGFYHYIDVDIYGPFDSLAWGEHEGTNRTLEVTILSEYDATAGYDYCVRIQNDRSAL